MKAKLAVLILAAAAAPVFAQTAVTSGTGATVTSGTGVTVTPSLPSASVTVQPTSAEVAKGRMLPGGTMVEYSSNTTTLGAGPATQTVTTTHYWTNVPANVERRGDFQRWKSLK